MSSKKVCHLTSVHPRYDSRIFLKECCSLAKSGYEVTLVVADGKGDEFKDNVSICDVGVPRGRLNRMFNTTQKVFKRAKNLDADIYHLHDPELLPVGLKLKKLGKTIIFDSHEDVPKQILVKPYLNKSVRWVLSKAFRAYENWSCKQLDAVMTATPFIRDKFLKINSNSLDINNYPILNELMPLSDKWDNKANQICYVGGIAAIRGIREIVQALAYVKTGARLQLGGHFVEQNVEEEVKNYAEWEFVDELGWLDRNGVKEVLHRSIAGLVTLHPVVNYIDALPVKMFEYMSAGIPVIASNFPLWREIIDKNDCGLCVDPMNPQEIAYAIDYLVKNTERARQMGENGQRIVHERYNWGIEEKKLLKIYATLIN